MKEKKRFKFIVLTGIMVMLLIATYIVKSISILVWGIGLLLIIEIVRFLFSKRSLPITFMDEYGVCRHNSYTYILGFLVCCCMVIIFTGIFINLVIPEKNILIFLAFGGLDVVAMIMTVTLFCVSWNRVVMVSSKEIIFRNIWGKVYRYSKNDVKGYKNQNGYHYHLIQIVTPNKVIGIRSDNVDCDDIYSFLSKYYKLLQ